MSDEKTAGQQLEAGVDPPRPGRDRQRDSSPSFSHVVNGPRYSCFFMDEALDEDFTAIMRLDREKHLGILRWLEQGGAVTL